MKNTKPEKNNTTTKWDYHKSTVSQIETWRKQMRSLNDSRWVFFVRCGCAQSFDDLFSSNESIYVYVTLWNELDLNSIAPPVCIHAWIYATTISFHNFQTKIGRSFVWFFYFRSTSIKNIDAFAYTIFFLFFQSWCAAVEGCVFPAPDFAIKPQYFPVTVCIHSFWILCTLFLL